MPIHSQFTCAAFTGLLREQKIAISMDGRGAWRDNVFVEQFWCSVKYEEVYLRAHDSVGDARASLGRYLEVYNTRRPHSSLGAMMPDPAYLDHLLSRMTPSQQQVHINRQVIDFSKQKRCIEKSSQLSFI